MSLSLLNARVTNDVCVGSHANRRAEPSTL
jgi:hypothetical protein